MLKQLMLQRKIAARRAELKALEEKRADIAARREAMKTREAELEAAVNEVDENTEQEAQQELDAALEEFQQEANELDQEEQDVENQVSDIENAISALESELEEIKDTLDTTAPADGGAERTNESEVYNMKTRKNMLPIPAERRDAFFAREDIKNFATRLREFGRQKRAVSGGELLIPEIVLPLIREITEEKSKLIKHVNLQSVSGTARQTVMGTIPEGVWTEMCAKLNELSLGFTAAEVDGYKVAGYIPVCNALLEDNDINLVEQVIYALGCAIALALDKAILYGTGTKMPLGIVTRLAQTAAPSGYSSTERAWADLHSSNIKSITAANSTGIKLFQNLIDAFGNASNKYGADGKFWAMNEKTHMKLVSEALNFNANGAIVAGIDGTMPVLGGTIEELDFIPDNVIIAGYGMCYLLAERAGVAIDESEHVRFLEDQTVFRGRARYDGKPIIAEGFVAIAIAGGSVNAGAVTFAADTANEDDAGEP